MVSPSQKHLRGYVAGLWLDYYGSIEWDVWVDCLVLEYALLVLWMILS